MGPAKRSPGSNRTPRDALFATPLDRVIFTVGRPIFTVGGVGWALPDGKEKLNEEKNRKKKLILDLSDESTARII